MCRRWLVLVVLCAACGDDHTKAVDASVDADPFGQPSDVYPAFRPGLPTIYKQMTGAVIASPRVVPVYFLNDTEAATLQDFLTKFAASPYWAPMVTEYGVGALTVASQLALTTDSPVAANDNDIQAYLTSQLDGTHAEWGPVDATTLASTIFLLHYPLGTTVTGPGPGYAKSCKTMGGYHENFALPSGARVAYAVTISCPIPPPYLATELDNTTAAISHELVEAVTDPKPYEGYDAIDVTSVAWAVDYGGELGDLCESISTNWIKPADLGYTMQRGWSNISAHAFHNPCVPVPAADMPFFATAPVEIDTVMIGTNKARGTNVHVGVPKTIELEFLSDGPTGGPWTVEALDDETLFGRPAILDFSFDRTTGENGQRVHLTITASSMPTKGFALYRLRSSNASTKTVWYGSVGIAP